MRLLFLYGLPATGKLTVAEELASRTGYRLFHNHLAVDLLLSVFAFGTSPFVLLREEIWLSVLKEASRSELPGLIFTFAPERTVRPGFPREAENVVVQGGGRVDFVELTCPIEELKLRIDSSSRLRHRKLVSRTLFEELYDQGVFSEFTIPKPRITLDTSMFTPVEAASRIMQSLGLVRHC